LPGYVTCMVLLLLCKSLSFVKRRSIIWLRCMRGMRMWPVATDAVAESVSVCFGYDCESCKSWWTDRGAIVRVDSWWRQEACFSWGLDLATRGCASEWDLRDGQCTQYDSQGGSTWRFGLLTTITVSTCLFIQYRSCTGNLLKSDSDWPINDLYCVEWGVKLFSNQTKRQWLWIISPQ